MIVEVKSATKNPVDVVSLAAGTCYGKRNRSDKRVRTCYQSGHMSVFEHVSATFLVSGISRACSHQLVRHRLASFSQMSQRYCKVDVSDDWYVVPPSFIAGDEEYFRECMADAAMNYSDALIAGVKPEDARYLLPEACKTELTMTMNCREIYHFLDLRQSKAAQWEIRELADEIEGKLYGISGWKELMELRRSE